MNDQVAQIVAAGGLIVFRPLASGMISIFVEGDNGMHYGKVCNPDGNSAGECMQDLFDWFTENVV